MKEVTTARDTYTIHEQWSATHDSQFLIYRDNQLVACVFHESDVMIAIRECESPINE